MNIKHLIKPLIPALLLAGAILVMIGLFIIPRINEINVAKNEIASKETDLARIQAKNKSLQSASRKKDEIATMSEIVNNLWPDKDEVSKFIVQMEGLANNSEIVLNNLSISESTAAAASNAGKKTDSDDDSSKKTTKKGTANQGIKFSFDTKTSYSTAVGFIQGLEKLARFNTLGTISLDSDSQGLISVRINGLIYAK